MTEHPAPPARAGESLPNDLHAVRFASHQLPPPGYVIVWSDVCEHFFWLNGDREGVMTWDRWAARQWAWDDYNRRVAYEKVFNEASR